LIGVPKDKLVKSVQQFLLPTASAVEIYDKETGKYLGQLGGSQYAPDSTNNPYGQYGSKYSADSINNP
jgi:hypothetical protein